MSKVFVGTSISFQTNEEFDKAMQNKFKTSIKSNKSVCMEEAMLMFIKKYGEKK